MTFLFQELGKRVNCKTTRIQCDVYAALNPEALPVSYGKTFF